MLASIALASSYVVSDLGAAQWPHPATSLSQFMHLGDNSILSCLGLGKDSVVSIALVQLRLDSKVVAVTKYELDTPTGPPPWDRMSPPLPDPGHRFDQSTGMSKWPPPWPDPVGLVSVSSLSGTRPPLLPNRVDWTSTFVKVSIFLRIVLDRHLVLPGSRRNYAYLRLPYIQIPLCSSVFTNMQLAS